MTKEELKQYIDQNVYENQDGEITGESLNAVLKAIVDEGGTEVEANPTGEATETLGKIKIGKTIYTAPQGPQGEPGEDGQDGQPGAPGPANTLSIGTVTDGEQAAANITGEAPNQQLNLVLPKGKQGDPGQNAVNPFKGWFNAVVTGEAGSRVITSETQNLPANPVVGDYAYVKTWDISGTPPSQTETPIARIYECVTSGSWSDSGRTADTSNVQTFETGEQVNSVGIDDEPTADSNNLVKSGGVNKAVFDIIKNCSSIVTDYTNKSYGILANGYFNAASSYKHGVIAVSPGDKLLLENKNNVNQGARYAFVTSDSSSSGGAIPFVDGYGILTIPYGKTVIVTIPDGCAYIIFNSTGTYANMNVYTYYDKIAKITELEQNVDGIKPVVDSLVQPSDNNLLNPTLAINNSVIGSDGTITNNNNGYWSTGFVEVSSLNCETLFLNRFCFRYGLFDENQDLIAVKTGTAKFNPISIDGNVKYIYISFDKNVIPFENNYLCSLVYANRTDCPNERYNLISDYYSIREPQFFCVTDILQFAASQKDKLFQQSFTYALYPSQHTMKNIIVRTRARYTSANNEQPTIRFEQRTMNGNATNYTFYKSPDYEFGSNGDEYIEKQWRIPALVKGAYLLIYVTIPNGIDLYIDELCNVYSDTKAIDIVGLRVDAHMSLWGNFCSKNAFIMSAKAGFPACIAVPDRTSDGVWVCFHDDSQIGASLVDENGNRFDDSEYSLSIRDITFERLSQLSYKPNYLGEIAKVPTLEDFFLICAKTGMKPTLSVHPVPSLSEWNEIKTLAKRIGVLSNLTIKIGANTEFFQNCYSVFGNDIDSYIGDANTSMYMSAISRMNAVGFDLTKVKVGIEYFEQVFSLLSESDMNTLVFDTLSAGFFVGAVHLDNTFSGNDIDKWIRRGVTYWTEKSNTSYGLNW